MTGDNPAMASAAHSSEAVPDEPVEQTTLISSSEAPVSTPDLTSGQTTHEEQEVSAQAVRPSRGEGQVLAATEILYRLEQGEIFRPGTWSQDNVRGAAYDLTIAPDYMVVPDATAREGRRHYRRGESCLRSVIVLKPGDLALFSTKEKFRLPQDLTANIGGKFSLARQGLLILTGQFVDPGYGLGSSPEDDAPKWQGERLHFLVTNIGNSEIALVPGQSRIATLQFLPLAGQTHGEQSFGSSDMDREFFEDPALAAMGLVSQVVSVQQGLAEIRRDEDRLRREIDRLERGTTPLILFGVIVVGSAFLGVVLTTLLVMAGNNELIRRITRLREAVGGSWQLLWLVIVLIFCIIGLGFFGRYCAATVARRLFQKRENEGVS